MARTSATACWFANVTNALLPPWYGRFAGFELDGLHCRIPDALQKPRRLPCFSPDGDCPPNVRRMRCASWVFAGVHESLLLELILLLTRRSDAFRGSAFVRQFPRHGRVRGRHRLHFSRVDSTRRAVAIFLFCVLLFSRRIKAFLRLTDLCSLFLRSTQWAQQLPFLQFIKVCQGEEIQFGAPNWLLLLFVVKIPQAGRVPWPYNLAALPVAASPAARHTRSRAAHA